MPLFPRTPKRSRRRCGWCFTTLHPWQLNHCRSCRRHLANPWRPA